MAEIKFYSDEHIPYSVTAGLRRRAVNILTAQEAGTFGQADLSQLQFATDNGRVLVTFDTDFLSLHQAGISHSVLIWSPLTKHTIGTLIQALLLIHGALSAEEMVNHIEYL